MASRVKSQLEAERQQRREAINDNFRKAHPRVAAAERAMRKDRVAREKAYVRRDKTQDGGTPETKAKAARVRQGSLARLYEAGHITIEQLAAGQQIRAIAERISAEVSVSTASLETRVDASRSGSGAFFEHLGAVRAEVAYRRWSARLSQTIGGAAPVLAMVVDDTSLTAAARRWGMRKKKARILLSGALDLWAAIMGEVVGEIDEADVLAMHAGLV